MILRAWTARFASERRGVEGKRLGLNKLAETKKISPSRHFASDNGGVFRGPRTFLSFMNLAPSTMISEHYETGECLVKQEKATRTGLYVRCPATELVRH